MQRQIKVTISPLGNPTIEAENFNGVGCEAATKGLEDALTGGTLSFDRALKPEWNNADQEQEQHVTRW